MAIALYLEYREMALVRELLQKKKPLMKRGSIDVDICNSILKKIREEEKDIQHTI